MQAFTSNVSPCRCFVHPWLCRCCLWWLVCCRQHFYQMRSSCVCKEY